MNPAADDRDQAPRLRAGQSAEDLGNLGKTIPAAVEPARDLTDYSGAERYDFVTGDAEAPASETVAEAVRAARETFMWCTTRIRAMKPATSSIIPQR